METEMEPEMEPEMVPEMEQKSEDAQQHQLTYSFHPYYGYLPTLVKKGDDAAEEQLYKLDPALGFVPAKTDEVEPAVVEETERKKREAQTFIYPSIYHPSPQGNY